MHVWGGYYRLYRVEFCVGTFYDYDNQSFTISVEPDLQAAARTVGGDISF